MVYRELRCMYVLAILSTDVCMCWAYCVPTNGEVRCMYGVWRGSVYACARHTVHRRMHGEAQCMHVLAMSIDLRQELRSIYLLALL